MNGVRPLMLAGVVSALSVPSLFAQAPVVKICDVLVIGGSAGGLAAAVGASELGAHVCLVEATP